MSALGDWIRDEFKSQAAFAEKLGVQQSRVSKWLSGAEAIPETIRDRIEALKYKGPWPREERQKAPPTGEEYYVTREEFLELKTALKVHIEYWERGEEKVLQRLMDALRRIERLEKGGG